MELAGSVFLSTMAVLGMTFATMSAIVVVLRHTTGSPVSSFQLYLTRLYIEQGFLVAGLSVLPMLIALLEFSHPAVWQWSSAIAAACLGAHSLSLAWRRRIVTGGRLTWDIRLLVIVRWALIFVLLLNAAGTSGGWSPGIYGAVVTYFLAQVCFNFSQRLKAFVAL